MNMSNDSRVGDVPKEINAEILSDLGCYLDCQDMVILIDKKNSECLTGLLCRSRALRETKKCLTIISTTDFPKQKGKHIYRKISEEEMDVLLRLYRSYEVSDKLVFFSDDLNYGSMWNYIKSGLANQEEMLQAMLA